MGPKTCQRVFIPRPIWTHKWPVWTSVCVKSHINSQVSPSGHSDVPSGHAHKIETLRQRCPDMNCLVRSSVKMELLANPICKLSRHIIARLDAQLKISNLNDF